MLAGDEKRRPLDDYMGGKKRRDEQAINSCKRELPVVHCRRYEMPPSVTINGAAHLPEEPVLVIPNRVDNAVLRALEEALGGMKKIAWMVEDTLRPDTEIMERLNRVGAQGILFSAMRGKSEALSEQIKTKLANGRHVVFLPGRPEQPAAGLSDIPIPILRHLLEGYGDQVLPVYVGMYRHANELSLITSERPYEHAVVSFLSTFIPGVEPAERLVSAWAVEASNCVGNVEFMQQETLSSALLRSLINHPRAAIIDGVNEQSISYRRLLTLAVPLARRLRKLTITRRMGIILPPGRLSIIANVACLLAGISPVNIDYNYSATIFRSVAEQAGLTRFITGNNFMQKQLDFPWPPSRDIFFIEELLEDSSFLIIKEYLVGHVGCHRLASWINMPIRSAKDEALAVFSLPEEGAGVRGTLLSHHAVMTGYQLTVSRLGAIPGQRVLSCLPFYYRAGLTLGLVYPLLSGQDIITYPEPYAAKRICELSRKYNTSMLALEPRQIPGILEVAQPGDFADGGQHILVAGRVPVAVAQRAYRDYKMALCECYIPLECAMPVACSMPPRPAREVYSPHVIPAGSPSTVGMVMPGLAVRITNCRRPDVPLGTGEFGLVWVKGEPLFSAFVQDGMPTPGTPTNRWVCTGDIGCMRPDGLLCVGGSCERFSSIEGELVSHARVEEILASILSIPQTSKIPRIAVVGIPTPDGRGEQMVLLSTLHKVVGPHDVITLRYAMVNERIPSQYAPQRIVALRVIPTLASGEVDYALCRRLALSAPGYRRSA